MVFTRFVEIFHRVGLCRAPNLAPRVNEMRPGWFHFIFKCEFHTDIRESRMKRIFKGSIGLVVMSLVISVIGMVGAASPASATTPVATTVTWSPTNTSATLAVTTLTPSVLATTAGDGAITYAVNASSTSDCTVNASTAVLNFTKAGSCIVTASSAATANYLAASASVTFNIYLASYTTSLSSLQVTDAAGSPLTLHASDNAGNGLIAGDLSYYTDSPSSISNPYIMIFPTATDSRAVVKVNGNVVPAGTPWAISYSNPNTELGQIISVTEPDNSSSTYWLYTPVTSSVGSVAVGATGTTAMAFQSPAQEALTITGISISGNSQFSFSSSTTSPSCLPYGTQLSSRFASCYVNVSFRPTAATNPASPVIAKLLLTATGASGKTYSQYLQVTGVGVGTGTISWNPTNLTPYLPTTSLTPNAAPVVNSGGAVTYSLGTSTPNAQCVVNPTTGALSWTSYGSCTEIATVAATSNYSSASTSATFTIYQARVANSVTWAPTNTTAQLPVTTLSPSVLASPTLSATVSYSIDPASTSDCAVNASSAILTWTTSGSCIVKASVPQTTSLLAASTSVTFTIYPAIQQVPVVWNPSNTSVNLPATTLTPSSLASTSGNGAITYSIRSDSMSDCSVNATTGVLTWTTPGFCFVIASSASTITYLSASTVVTFSIYPALVATSVSWAPTNTVATLPVTTLTPSALATTNGDGAITYSIDPASTSGCSVNPSTAVLTWTQTGTCVVVATSPLTNFYSAASTSVTFIINPVPLVAHVTWSPAVTSGTLPATSLTPSVLATTDGNGAISYSVNPASTSNCAVDSATGVLSWTTAGSCIVTASSAATVTYLAASTSVTFTIFTQAYAMTLASLVVKDASGNVLTLHASDGTGNGVLANEYYYYADSPASTTNTSISITAIPTDSRVTVKFNGIVVTPGTPYVISYTSSSTDVGGILSIVAPDNTSKVYAVDFPVPHSMGALPVGQTSVQTISINIPGNELSTITGLSISGDSQFTVASSTTSSPSCLLTVSQFTGPLAICYVTVTFKPTSVSNATSLPQAKVLLSLTGASGKHYSQYLALTGTGTGTGSITWNPTVTTARLPVQTLTPSPLASSNSGGAMTYTVSTTSNTAGCSINSATAVLAWTTSGTCTVVANLAATTTYTAATKSVTFTVSPAFIAPTITWAPTNTSVALPVTTLTPSALASSNGSGAITYAVDPSSTSNCAVNASTAVLSWTSTGSCVVVATSAATSTYLAGTKSVTFTINPQPYVTTLNSLVITDAAGNPLTLHPSATGTNGFDPNESIFYTDTVASSTNNGFYLTVVPTDSRATIKLSGSPITTMTSGVPYFLAAGFALTYPTITITEPNSTSRVYYLYMSRPNPISPVGVGKTSTTALSFVNIGNMSETVSAVSISGDPEFALVSGSQTPACASGLVMNAGGGCYFSISFTASGVSSITNPPLAQIALNVTGADGRNYVEYVAASSSGVLNAATVSWSPTNTSATLPVSTLTPSALASSLNTSGITYSVDPSSTSNCSVGSTSAVLSWTTAGTCTVVASVAASSTYTAASKSVTFTINPAPVAQHVTWAPTNLSATLPVLTLTPSALAVTDGNGAITYSVDPASTVGCAVNATTAVVTWTKAGTCVIKASAAATAGYLAATASVTFTINPAVVVVPQAVAQHVTWAPTNLSATLPVTTLTPSALATTDGNGAVTYSVDPASTSDCAVNATTAAITWTKAGTCVIKASAAATAGYLAATASVTFTINAAVVVVPQAVAQHVTWAPTNLSATLPVTTLTPSALAVTDGDGAITYSVDPASTSDCAVNATTTVVTWTKAGTCVIKASAAATAGYLAATASVTFTINAAPAVVTPPAQFAPPMVFAPALKTPVITYQDALTVGADLQALAVAKTDSDGAISYKLVDAGTTGCAIGSATPSITATAEGNCVIEVDVAATSNFAAATKKVTITIVSSSQQLVINSLPTAMNVGETTAVQVAGNASSALSLTVNSDSTAICSSNGLTVQGLAAGTCNFTVTSPKTGLWQAANVVGKITVNVQESASAGSNGGLNTIKPAQQIPAIVLPQVSIWPKQSVQIPTAGLLPSARFDAATASICSVSSTGLVVAIKAGSCSVGVTIPADADHSAASKTLSINVLATSISVKQSAKTKGSFQISIIAAPGYASKSIEIWAIDKHKKPVSLVSRAKLSNKGRESTTTKVKAAGFAVKYNGKIIATSIK